jgi:aryl-alcohol dehydrogenase-like predicted oxidoreductase
MKYVALRGADITVSALAYGTWELGGHWGQVDEEESVKAIRRAADLGITLFDTAQAYGFGAAERLLARALRDDLDHRRDEVIIATKGGMQFTDVGVPYADSDPEYLRRGLESSLRALSVDYIDIYQVHAPDPQVPFAETAGLLGEFVAQGKIRHAGVSNYDATQLAAFSARRKPATLQVPYSLFCRAIESAELPYALAHEIGVLAYAPLAHGMLGGVLRADTQFAADDWRHWNPFFQGEAYHRNLEVVRRLERFAREQLGVTLPQLAIAWTLTSQAVDVAIVGARQANHVEESAAAADVVLDADAVAAVDKIMADAVAFPRVRYERQP